MSSSGFTVEPATLRAMASSLLVLSCHLDTVQSTCQSIDPSDFGHPSVGSKTKEFADKWRWQSEQVGKKFMDVSNKLKQVADNYQAVEDAQRKAQGNER